MMKKTLALLLAALLIFSLLSACSKEPSAVTDDPAVDTQAPEQEPEQPAAPQRPELLQVQQKAGLKWKNLLRALLYMKLRQSHRRHCLRPN